MPSLLPSPYQWVKCVFQYWIFLWSFSKSERKFSRRRELYVFVTTTPKYVIILENTSNGSEESHSNWFNLIAIYLLFPQVILYPANFPNSLMTERITGREVYGCITHNKISSVYSDVLFAVCCSHLYENEF